MEKIQISIVLDRRRIKTNGKYPVKLRVYDPFIKRQKLYSTIFEYTESDFASIWQTTKPRNHYKEHRGKLGDLERKAEKIAKNIQPFSFELFEKHLLRKEADGAKLAYQYKTTIAELKRREQIGTATTYQSAEKAIIDFVENFEGKKYQNFSLRNVTPKWLQDFEDYITKSKERSPTTASMYIRTLRTIFNKAIAENEVSRDFYPFELKGNGKYKVPATRNVKKALSKPELKAFFHSVPRTPEQEKAKDFWFFSYICSGMNIKDIVLLRYKNIINSKIVYYRAKTRATSKGDLTQIEVDITPFAKGIIEKYGKEDPTPNEFVFDIVNDKMTAEQRHNAIRTFTRYVNQHTKKLASKNGLPGNISTYWARHSFASNFVLGGATIVDAMESLGHSNIQTTQNYLRSFPSETKKQIAASLMDFE